MSFVLLPEGKNVFISIDSRTSNHNPLYNALKAKSFTDGDITLHFIIFDILYNEKDEYGRNYRTYRAYCGNHHKNKAYI